MCQESRMNHEITIKFLPMLVLLLVSTLLLGSVDVNGVELLANPNGEGVLILYHLFPFF